MKIELDTTQGMGLTTLRLSHRGEESFWDISSYYQRSGEKTPALADNTMFDEINAYWAQLSPERQQAIWDTYCQAREILDTHYDIDALRRPLAQVVKQLYDLMPIQEIAYWSKFQGIRLPSTLKDHYGDRDPPDRTYLRQDYQGLVALAIALRPMLPIWGEFIGSTHKEAGNAFKEYQALRLLQHASITQSQEWQRLELYVHASLENSQQPTLSSTAVLTGLGSAEMPTWLLGLVVVRRLTVAPISAKEDNSSLISNIHQYISNTLKSQDRKLGTQKFGGTGKVSDKNKPDKNPEDQKASVVELYKVKQEVSDGDLVILNVYTEDVHRMAAGIDPTYDAWKVDRCVECIQQLQHLRTEPHWMHLAQWVVHPVMSPRGVPHLNKPSLLRVLAVTQALLWHWGFYDLAALATASPLQTAEDQTGVFAEGRPRIPKQLVDQAGIHWPHYRAGRGKQVTERQQNVGTRAADKFCDAVTANDWQLHCPTELLELTSRYPNTRRLKLPQDIRATTMNLLFKVSR